MVNQVRTVDFLPEIFQTPTNRQFLNATLDQLVQEPNFQKTQGYVGRKIGPGVNPVDKYVIEPTKSRNDYQLEPGVVTLNPETRDITDAITYPGINDALRLQGGYVTNPDGLYASEYYAWDPFVDFDKLINYSQYYWLPGGPLAVDVSSTDIPLTDNFIVTRDNGVYSFSGVNGENPQLTLLRNGSYTFEVAQNNKETVNYRVTNGDLSAYLIDYEPNPTKTLVRGNTYVFTLSLTAISPFYIKTLVSLGNTNLYSDGVTNNGATEGIITFTVPQDAPDVLYYSSSTEVNMRGQFNIIDATPGTGPGFWIQTNPGVDGRIPSTPNISSRSVLGVTNNGEDLGTVTFDVPLATAQNFYYTLTSIGTVDLITNLQFDQINNQSVTAFTAQYGGIDGISSLNGRTLVFQYTNEGWEETVLDDPFASTPIVDPAIRYGIWQIQYVTLDGTEYLQLTSIGSVAELEKFSIIFGNQYSSTQWYKNTDEYFEEIPLLTALNNILYYQDGTDPEIFGIINIIDDEYSSTLDVDTIIGKKNYTSPNGVVFTNGLKVVFRGDVIPSGYQNNEYYVEGVGTAIKLLPTGNFITPETYTQSESIPYDSTPYDFGNYDATLNAPLVPDYLTISRASPDLNAWTRSNRWFHIDVIEASAAYNNTTAVVDNLLKARRPILEFRAGTRLFKFGTEGKQPIDIIDFAIADAFSTINGSTGYSIDGYSLVTGSRIIFANDTDSQVRNKIYTVEFITPDTEEPLIAEPIINLVLATDATVLANQTIVCLSGSTLQGKSFYFDGVEWLSAQEKTTTNQAPLFDVYDSAGISLSDSLKYPSSTFTGSKLFSYAVGNSTIDPVLGFALKYLSLANVGDIVFDNNLYKDTFTYVDLGVGTAAPISSGFVRQYLDRVNFVKEIGWQTAVTRSLVRQQFQYVYDAKSIILDVKVNDNSVVPAIQLYVNAEFQDPSTYTYVTSDKTTTITLNTLHTPGDLIEIAVLSNQISSSGFFQIPINLENNPLNANSDTFTLGTARSHYQTIGENLIGIRGPIIGQNNIRDLGNVVPYGLQILQQSSPLTLAGYFMRSQEYDIFSAIDYNSREYIKFKSLLLETVVRNEYGTLSVAEILDSAIADITQGRTDINPFYWSDMLPTGSVYTETVNLFTPISTQVFNTSRTYNFTSANYQGLLVYRTTNANTQNEETVLLERNAEYIVSTDSPRLTITIPLTVGDIITVREYESTAGSFVPNTPTKLGLYPKYLPKLFVDTNYVNPTAVIQGHDGSITVAFNDFRDLILLEFEKRIYNNLKTDDNPIPLTMEDVIPGFFRQTDYTQTETTAILGESFLTWVGWNKLDYKAQDYIANNEFTYNYSSAANKVDEVPLLGAWRGIYRYFYDTASPDTTPWEMLGLSEMPLWWEDRYGPAPYTSDNLVLWDDLEIGLVADPIAPYIKPNFARPGLTSVIPVGSEGQLLSPLSSVVGSYDSNAFRKSWAVGDGGPVEASWWSSSSYPFAVMRLLALTKPAEFFALFADRDLYKYDLELEQYLYNGRYRLDANGIEVYGNGVSKASYIDWIVDYNRQLGRDSTTVLTSDLRSLDVRLCYRMASFTDKQYLKVYVERSSPNSTNSSLLLPDESFNLLLYKNQPFAEIVYSALIIEKVADGYSVYGYNNSNPYFQILASSSSGRLQPISGGGATVRVPAQYTNEIVQVPYGFVFTNTTMVVDFILSYGAYLEGQGLIFDDRENGYTLNWSQMATEFLYFSQQGWADNTIINLNPTASTLKAYRPGAIVDTIISYSPENMLLDQNRQTLPTRDLVVQRDDDAFLISSTTNQTISFLHLKFTNYESTVILDNLSIFNDLIYDPITAARQNRIRIIGSTSTDWTGQLDAQGFILNKNNIVEWKSNKKYAKGEIVIYKNNYWSAQTIVQPKINFDFNDWVKSDYTAVQTGLLPNIANKADQLANSYNTQVANLERDNDLLSYGLIGFRPRQYMTDLNLDDVSQVNLYQQFLGSKGTILSAELFTRADLGKESGAYNIFENWGVLAGTYGANANRSFFELRLNEAFLQSDPCTVQVINPLETSQANQTVLLNDIWRESYKLTSPEILPTVYPTVTDTALPSAGYVNLDDVDITVFSLDDPTSISIEIDQIGVGTTIWAAKSNSYDWNIYRCSRVPGQLVQLTDNLNATSIAQFTTEHNLTVGDLVILRYFSDSADGVYRVLATPSIKSIVISFDFINTDQTLINGTGLVFYLQTMRVSQASDVNFLPYVNSLVPGARAYVDNNGSGHWQVLEKQSPFTEYDQIVADIPVANSKFGASISQTENLFSSLIGSPFDDTGRIYAYRQGENNTNYVQDIILTLDAPNVSTFGNSVDIGQNIWAVVGANTSDNDLGYATTLYRDPVTGGYSFTQLFVSPDREFGPTQFGTAVVMSRDERWMYISSPLSGSGTVHAYGRVDVENQSATYRTTGTTQTYNWSNSIVIDYAQPDQLFVTLNNRVAILGVDYTVNQYDIVFTTTPDADQLLIITRRQAAQLDSASYYNIEQTSTSGSGTDAQFTVINIRGMYNPTISSGGVDYVVDDILVIAASDIATTASGTPPEITASYVSDTGTTLVVDDTTGIVVGMTVSGTGFDGLQQVIAVSLDGVTVTLNSEPDSTPSGTLTFNHDLKIQVTEVGVDGNIISFISSGTGYTIDTVFYPIGGVTTTANFSLSPYLYTATNINAFTVLVNGELQRPEIDYDFNTDSALLENILVFEPSALPPAGATISILASTYWQYCDTINVGGLPSNANFGISVTTSTDGRQVQIGVLRDNSNTSNGAVYIFDRSVVRYLIQDTDVVTYSMPGSVTNPVSVVLNGQFLNVYNSKIDGVTTTQSINGQYNIDYDTNEITLLSNLSLTVGDILEIETNQFQQIQKIIANSSTGENAFGYAMDLCPTNCSLYIGAPFDSRVLPEAGSVERHVNQTRVYGVITSDIANPTLVAGDTIRINNTEVEIAVSSWSNGVIWNKDTVVTNGVGFYKAIVTVPTGIAITDVAYWAPTWWTGVLVYNITAAQIPNVIATTATNIIFEGDGNTKNFEIGSTYSVAESYSTVVYVDNALQTYSVDYTYNNTTGQIIFVTAPLRATIISVIPGRITIGVKNILAATSYNRLTVLPGVVSATPSVLPTAFDDLGFTTDVYTQTIVSPSPSDYAKFGSAVDIDSSAINLVVGAPFGNIYEPVTFDNNETYFDDRSTTFFTPVFNSGVVYTYDFLPSAISAVTSPGQFVFGQQIFTTDIQENDAFGSAVNFTSGRLMAGAPGSTGDYGLVEVFDNPTNAPAWAVVHTQQPVVDVNLINSVYMYDRLTSTTQTYFDFIDPLQGKILGAARRNIDYIGAVDPASYNVGTIHNYGSSWNSAHVGEMWWDTDTVRFIDPNQDDIIYASRRWAQVFPGSRVDVYQWIESSVPPISYTGPGTPLSTVSYSVNTALSKDNIFQTKYYFWVRGITTIAIGAGKTLSTTGVARYIEDPRNSGIPYIAALNASTIAIYNGLQYISAADTILHIDYDRQVNDANIHTEYELIADGRADSFLNGTLYRKLQDSFCGVDTSGAVVPDPFLSPAERYGVQFRPRQSMFVNRFTALQNYLGRANTIIKQFPIVETRRLNLLNSAEPEPLSIVDSTVIWNKRVANLEELSYQNINAVPLGYAYLVDSDSSQHGFWTIYQVADSGLVGQRTLALTRVQNYDTRLYWNHINWYLPGYNSTVQPIAEVANYSGLGTLSLASAPIGSSVKVTANGQGKFEIYLRTALGWDRVGLQDGTLEFKEELWNYSAGNFGFDAEVFDSQYFDQEPVIETRKIIQAINEEIFIDDLAIERNQSLILMFNYIYSESIAPEWLIKTSLVDVDHTIRALLPFQTYLQDNQTFVLDYIQEVKPYHVQIREFNLAYYGEDVYPGELTDFDIPAYWDVLLPVPKYVSPVLTPYTLAGTVVESTDSDAASNAEIWTMDPWKEWFNNYLLSVQEVEIIAGGSGYTTPPTVTVVGECTEPATMVAVLNSAGQVATITVLTAGAGYATTATITITGGGGNGARAVAIMGNDLVRSIKTVIKYDRNEYTSTIVDWEANVYYANGTQVRYLNKVWEANSTTGPGVDDSIFDITQWNLVDASTLSGADRTMGYYTPTANQVGLSLPLLIDGIDYPGVQVYGPDFNQNTGYDVGNFDINPFDNISFGPEGQPTYDPAILDAIYESIYLDPYMGTAPAPAYNGAPPNQTNAVIVDGGGYVDVYSSHAPEELVPGAEFDTLDMRIYTRPGSDWQLDGHGFPQIVKNFVFDETAPTITFAGVLPYPVQITVTNQTTGIELNPGIDYTVAWTTQTITILNNVTNGDIISVAVFELGGGNQLLKETYNGADVGDTIIVPVEFDTIQEFAIFVNGTIVTNYTFESYAPSQTVITFVDTYTITDFISLVAIGVTIVNDQDINYSWSAPQTQIITADGSSTYALSNSLEYTNPDNLIVTVNGVRVRTSAGIEWYGDGSSEYLLPERLGFSQALIADNEVHVYLDDVPQTYSTQFVLEPYTGGTRRVVFATEPALGTRILICVSTRTDCYVNSDDLVFATGSVPANGDIIAVTTWNDTRQQNILTEVFVGPVTVGSDTVNNLTLGRIITDPSRLWVTLNGNRLFNNNGFTISNEELILTSGIMSPTDIVMITEFTNSVVPEAMAFRIFQDMRGVQAVYRMTTATTTQLVESLSATDDIIYVEDASSLSQPDLTINIWGVITINGERIMYRERNTTTNTISSLLRGTAGTGAADHITGSSVYDMGRGNLLPAPYQNYIVSDTFVADGSTTTYVATSIDVSDLDSTSLVEAVEVYVAGIRVSTGYTITGDSPVVIEFDTPPADNLEITILVRRGVTWYAPGIDTPSDGVALQDTDTQAARFLRGL